MLNKDKIKYVTGQYRSLETYPTTEDILYLLVVENGGRPISHDELVKLAGPSVDQAKLAYGIGELIEGSHIENSKGIIKINL